MDPIAIVIAKERLEKARASLAILHQPTNFKQVKEAWAEFLFAANGVYAKLEKGSKISDASRKWYRKIKQFRRDDELLRYVHRARDAEEHGLHPIMTMQQGTPKLEPIKDPAEAKIPPDRRGKEIVIELNQGSSRDPIRLKMTLQPSRALLIPAKDDRFGGSICQLPRTHLGQPLLTKKIAEAAGLVVDYLERLIAEASNLNPTPDGGRIP